jgi:hypothetical protein
MRPGNYARVPRLPWSQREPPVLPARRFSFRDSDLTKRTKDRPGKPAWRPRSSGSRIDKTSDQYKADLRNAERGIPHFGVLKWLEVQAFDNGASDKPGHVRWKLKLSFTAADVALLSRQGKRDVSRTRFAPLSTPAAFKRNLRRRKGRWKPTTECLAVAHELCAMVEGKDALLGQVSMRFGGEGTIAYPGQFALLV